MRKFKISDLCWLKKTNDLPSPKKILEFRDDNGINWLLLSGFVEWQEDTPPEIEKYQLPTRRLWYIIQSYLVSKKDVKKVFDWARGQNFMGRWMPESHQFYNVFLGEYPWAPAFIYYNIPYYNHDGWTDNAKSKKMPAKVLITDDEYLSSGSSIDCSTNETISVKLPAKWLVDNMNLNQPYIDGRFFDQNGDLIVFDPTLFEEDYPRVLLIKKDRFCRFLDNKGYSILWILLGEKNMIGGRYSGEEWLGRLEISGAYLLDSKDKITGDFTTRFVK